MNKDDITQQIQNAIDKQVNEEDLIQVYFRNNKIFNFLMFLLFGSN